MKDNEMNIPMIGKIYKYKELCSMFDEEPKKSNAKKAQLKRWRTLFSWENPTTHTYKIIDVYDEPKEIEDMRKNNGGFRTGSGRKPKLQEEFDYLFNAFLHREYNRHIYHGQNEWHQIYFFNGDIGKYFGMYGDRFYKAREDFAKMLMSQNVDMDMFSYKTDEFNRAWSDISKKITEKRRAWIYNKIDKMDGVTLENGIMAYIDKKHNEFEYKDEYGDRWDSYRDEYLKKNKLRTVADVVDRGMWDDMISYISEYFEGYEVVERPKKVTFDIHILKDYEWDEYSKYKNRFNDVLVCELLKYFGKRVSDDEMKMYRYVIEKYVKL